jgi:rSAM/selenodomain-associated transferase 2
VKRISVVMPVLNEAQHVERALRELQPLRQRGHEVIVVDGDSGDGTADLARPLADQLIGAPKGRASQMNAGARAARAEVLLFLHCDTQLPEDADRMILNGLQETNAAWGRFDVRIEGRHPLLRGVAAMMNLRSRASGICTGDQAIFVYRELFLRLQGYPPIALMEDIALSRMLRRVSAPHCIHTPVHTSGRRWERAGVVRTILLMWWLRLRYFLGVSPARLARLYERER